LIEGDVDFVLVGGYSAVLHGSTQMTRDVDVVCSLDAISGTKLVEALKGIHPTHRMVPDPRPLVVSDFGSDGLQNLYLKTDLGILDCLGEVRGVGDLAACKARSEKMTIGDIEFQILDILSLIEAKIAMGRPRDLVTAKELETIVAQRNRTRPSS